VTGEKWVVRGSEALEERSEAGVPGVAHGDQGVAEEAAVPGSLHRAVGKDAPKVFFGQRGQPVEPGVEE
jgi:hypothetical protein